MSRLSIVGSRNPNWRGGAAVPCHACGKEVWRKPSKRQRANYCSVTCSNAAKGGAKNARWTGGPEIRQCKVCDGEFKATRREITKGHASYCSARCSQLGKRKVRTERQIAGLKLHRRMTRLMHHGIRRGTKGGRSWQSLVGYSIRELMTHMEERFVPGMSWANLGEWHIDHVRPRASFEFAAPDEPQFRECWALSNLQPLWAKDNLRKGSRLVAA